MAVITADTYVKLVRFDVTKEHQLTFSDIASQTTFFNNLSGIVLSDFTYQRKDNVIRYPALYEDIEKYNYLVYCNEAQSNKYYYCYITEMKYINDEMTEIYIETDVFQTWQFDIIYKEMFVEREHVNDDTIGVNTVPENLETGEFIVNNQYKLGLLSEYAYVLQVSKLDSGVDADAYTNFGGLPQYGGFYVFDNIIDLQAELANYGEGQGQVPSDALLNCYIVPKVFLEHNWNTTPYIPKYIGQNTPKEISISIPKLTTINGYTPINNKLFTYPYCYITLTNNIGANNILHFEKFSTSYPNCYFKIEGVPTITAPSYIYPTHYNGIVDNYLEKISLGTYPQLNFKKDNFGDWLIYNGISNNVGARFGAVSTVGAMAGLWAGMVAPVVALPAMAVGAYKFFSSVSERAEHSKIPNSAQGTFNGDILTAQGENTFYLYSMSIKQEFARQIDEYFSLVGYKVNRVKLPNITGRQNWNFVKTIGCNIEGTEIPEKDIEILKEMFDNGITFWHNYSNFRDYSVTNNIIV